ncbi:hypothetical protein KSF_011410 [Reticulibacter mediterranei]|uniref:Mycothiol-dependent maleylpyruvate isomerase metal-binding domain-containing protein n=1 Tax=Reticulibacter mediterranei TaxID=2778369 RepID=A0A8J3IEL6_9CHLR|nr:SCP2 sterol-binding domain-containing protein [Reticulibacter mediterranei]GHO91093.1 hypothetical protein KSF_011410 [Reticulibacter mediterranei]
MSRDLVPVSQAIRCSDVILDLSTHTKILLNFLEETASEVWQQRGRHVRRSEWTLHQTVAHLAASAEFYRAALQRAVLREKMTVPDLQQRRDLPAYNQREIQLRHHQQPPELIAALQQALEETLAVAQQLAPEQFAWPVAVPIFNRPLTVIELLETQIMHSSMVHVAQIARPANKEPLWRRYDPPALHRTLGRFFRLISLTYWPERGGNLRATFQFLVAGDAGGEWYVSVSPGGGQAGEGRVLKPQVTLWAANADALCLLFTDQISIGQALLRRKLVVRGNLLLATKLSQLFSPT